jgi:hypothetical protein
MVTCTCFTNFMQTIYSPIQTPHNSSLRETASSMTMKDGAAKWKFYPRSENPSLAKKSSVQTVATTNAHHPVGPCRSPSQGHFRHSTPRTQPIVRFLPLALVTHRSPPALQPGFPNKFVQRDGAPPSPSLPSKEPSPSPVKTHLLPPISPPI